jgi:hypothetical protein
LAQEQWSPTARLLTAAGRGGPIAVVSGITGLALLARALTNLPPRRLTGVGAGHRAIDLLLVLRWSDRDGDTAVTAAD